MYIQYIIHNLLIDEQNGPNFNHFFWPIREALEHFYIFLHFHEYYDI